MNLSLRDALTSPAARCFLALVWTLSMSGCEGGGAAGPSGPREGFWVGDEVSFTVQDGAVTQWVIHQAVCAGDDACERQYKATLDGSWPTSAGLSLDQEGYFLEGTFSSATMAHGSFHWGAQSEPCCRSIGAWTAQWQAPLTPTGGTDGGRINGGGGAVDWAGASLGDLHPGPANGPMEPTGSEGLSEAQQAAHAALLHLRAQVGAGSIAQDAQLAQAAQAHADFYTLHHAKYKSAALSPHDEDESFGEGFTGVKANQRMKAAGFSGTPGAEVMAFTGSPEGAVQGWLETVYHRLPLVHPAVTLFGYGGSKSKSTSCEVMDFDAASDSASDPVIVYPWPGQTDVPLSWSGNEGPQPPPPPGGYPSGPVITLRVPGVTAWGQHQLTEASGASVPHMFLSADNDPNMKLFDRRSVAIYAHAPLTAGTTYEVRVQVSIGSDHRTVAWRFTTAP